MARGFPPLLHGDFGQFVPPTPALKPGSSFESTGSLMYWNLLPRPRDGLTYMVRGIDQGPRASRRTQRYPPPSCHTVAHPVSQLSPSLQLGGVGGLAQCWGHRCEHSEKRDLFMWAAMLGLELSP